MTRLLLTLLVVAVLVSCVAGMWLGWRNRARRQAYLPALPAKPDELGAPLLPSTTGVYVGTTTAGDWQDRIVAHGLGARAAVDVTLYERGLSLGELWLPAESLVDARTDRALAGKVMGPKRNDTAGLLVFRWKSGDQELDSGVRGDEPSRYSEWITRVHAMKSARAQGGQQA